MFMDACTFEALVDLIMYISYFGYSNFVTSYVLALGNNVWLFVNETLVDALGELRCHMTMFVMLSFSTMFNCTFCNLVMACIPVIV